MTGVAAQGAPPDGEPTPHTYRRTADTALHAYVFSPARRAPSRPAVLLFHGGGWTEGAPDWVFDAARQFAASGMVAIAIEYRLANDTLTPRDQRDDACAAFRWARDSARPLGLDPTRVAGYGVSAGGQLVGLLGTRGCADAPGRAPQGGPDAMVLLSPALDLARDPYFVRLLRGRGVVADYSPVAQQRGRGVPTLIVHGEQDSLTPAGAVRRFCTTQRAAGGRCALQIYPGVGHLLTRNLSNQMSEYDPDPALRRTGLAAQVQFLRTLWRLGPPARGR
ncbi:MAG: alpha/beta hydrolase [Gemmatimonadaceae bacterium]|nr:alpha/beta hydrolase [Gemmatimonadaceae bacterium]